ncbi:hypothetical protein PTKIN_Ptkin16aG0085100 [Pterospermum kingtungense]
MQRWCWWFWIMHMDVHAWMKCVHHAYGLWTCGCMPMAVLPLLAMATPIAFAARNEVVPSVFNNDDVNNIRNPFANIFLILKPAQK